LLLYPFGGGQKRTPCALLFQAVESRPFNPAVSTVVTNDGPVPQSQRAVSCRTWSPGIRHGCTIDDARLSGRRTPRLDRYLKSPQEMARSWSRYPQAYRPQHSRSAKAMCRFSRFERNSPYQYPEENGSGWVYPPQTGTREESPWEKVHRTRLSPSRKGVPSKSGRTTLQHEPAPYSITLQIRLLIF